jgi:hypothetical protein
MADRRNEEVRLDWWLVPEHEWQAADPLLVIRARNAGGKPVMVEQMGVLSLDRVLRNEHGCCARSLLDSSSWLRSLPEPSLLERGGLPAEFRVSIQDLAHAGFSMRWEKLAPVIVTSDGRIRRGRIRFRWSPLSPALEALLASAEKNGQAREGATKLTTSAVILGVDGPNYASKRLDRVVRDANRERRGDLVH